MSETKHTPGPWAWFGDATTRFYLATVHGGRNIVMDFTRMGMRAAQPRFNVGGIMQNAASLAQFEVGPRDVRGIKAAKQPASGVYRFDVTGVDHPDARLIAAAPDLLEAAKHAAMEWRLHGQLTDSCRVLEAAIAKAENRQPSDWAEAFSRTEGR